VTSVESLGDEGARVWMLAGDALAPLRQALLDADTEVEGPLNAVEQYPTFTPHVTIGYPTDPDEGTEVEAPGEEEPPRPMWRRPWTRPPRPPPPRSRPSPSTGSPSGGRASRPSSR
jgi:hypothetical protein